MTSSNATNTAAAPAWWRTPHMWLVVGAPLVGVAASLTAAFFAINGADPVLNKADYQRDFKAAHALQGQARIDALAKLQPAHQARNNAASPVIPAE
ncbi:nitrogen fixation protein FixH [Hydrogenophaga sp. PBL-H3]|uniref:nitrogen fixation protein FixH n=1 Tax=Hydrogenophaga sp. PBL-H3 TaxID=434010 RepID=UPI0013202069|nr:nitrogen fixation protein FixH [Hydrogenophaga sp. PBL-H3]QHE76795.1 nitrogen fixation protein FixH [Hydrogenophaga sp. PBL-H3]QHE81219.1 nitrogen fixation protein FixH [Hydrogenophaga sp. PBL-H3]